MPHPPREVGLQGSGLTQKDRRNLSDAEFLRLIELVDRPQTGLNTPVASVEATDSKPRKTAKITADILGTSRAKVERARAVLSTPRRQPPSVAVRRAPPPGGGGCQGQACRPTSSRQEVQHTNDKAVAEGLCIIGLLHVLVQRDPSASRVGSSAPPSNSLSKSLTPM